MITEQERKKLIEEWPNCKFKCQEGRPFSCDCKECRQFKGYFEKGEMEALFNPVEIALVKAAFGEQGWLGEHGCLLAPAYRSGKCLATDCHPFPKRGK